jgi:Zn-dependent protease
VPGLALLSGSPFLLGWAKPVPINPYNLRYGKWGEALTAFAGPGTNLLIAAVAGLLVRFAGLASSPEILNVVFIVVLANISLAILNMIPIPPLDGSKIVAALLPPGLYMRYRELEHMTYAIGPFGLILVLIVIVNFLSAPMGALVGSIFSLLTGVSF